MQTTNGALLAMTVATLFVAACEQKAATPSAEGKPSGDPAAGDKAQVASAGGSGMPAAPAPGSGEVQCLGIHECKGKSACHVVGSHACAGQNSCKGKGWITVPLSECQAKGGKVLDS